MLDNYTRTFIRQAAERAKISLTQRHLQIITYAWAYYELGNELPTPSQIEMQTQINKNEIEALFPRGIDFIADWHALSAEVFKEKDTAAAPMPGKDYREIYFDHDLTTPIRDEIKPYLQTYIQGDGGFAAPTSVSINGKKAFDQVMAARKQIACVLSVRPSEITFTSSRAEANNLGIKGIAFKYHETKGHIITTNIAHPSILESVQFLGMLGYHITFLDVDAQGVVSPDAVGDALRSDTILVAVMAVNHDIGTINPIKEIGQLCRLAEVPLLVDATHAFGRIPLNPKDSGISLMSFSGHRIYAPKGVGALFIDERISIVPLIHGCGQELNKRSGIENIEHILAFGEAAALAEKERTSEYQRITELKNYFIQQLEKKTPGYLVNGSLDKRVPHNLNIGFPGVDSDALLIELHRVGIHASTGAWCGSESIAVSPVIQALDINTDQYGIIRFSFGLKTRKTDIDYLFKHLPVILSKLRNRPGTAFP